MRTKFNSKQSLNRIQCPEFQPRADELIAPTTVSARFMPVSCLSSLSLTESLSLINQTKKELQNATYTDGVFCHLPTCPLETCVQRHQVHRYHASHDIWRLWKRIFRRCRRCCRSNNVLTKRTRNSQPGWLHRAIALLQWVSPTPKPRMTQHRCYLPASSTNH